MKYSNMFEVYPNIVACNQRKNCKIFFAFDGMTVGILNNEKLTNTY